MLLCIFMYITIKIYYKITYIFKNNIKLYKIFNKISYLNK